MTKECRYPTDAWRMAQDRHDAVVCFEMLILSFVNLIRHA